MTDFDWERFRVSGPGPPNNFGNDLAWSKSQANDPIWEAVYRQAFPLFAGMHYVAHDGWAQRAGIDRLVVLNDGRTLTVDEKTRRQVWPDILLELWSNYQRHSPGWLTTLASNYLAYLFAPIKTCYLFPTLSLQAAWQQNETIWTGWAKANDNGFRVVKAENPGYTTIGIAVPVEILLQAITDTLTVKVDESPVCSD